MAKNKIIVFANQKGGVGKTTLCCMMAHRLVADGKKVVVYDADLQQNLHDRREAELQANPDAKAPWEIKRIDTLDFDYTKKQMDEAALFDGYVLIDAPGSLALPGLALLFQMADAIVIPFGYEFNILQSTVKFLHVLLAPPIEQEKKRLFLVPNMIDEHIGTKVEKEQNEKNRKALEKLANVTYRVKRGVAVQRCSTLTFTEYQSKATMGPWTTITNALRRL